MFVFKAAVVGAGTMGGQIAQTIAAAGIPVVLKDVKQELVDHGLEEARDVTSGAIAKLVKKGKLTEEQAAAQVEEVMARITGTLDYSGFGDVDLVVEAVPERMEIKQAVFAELDAVTPGPRDPRVEHELAVDLRDRRRHAAPREGRRLPLLLPRLGHAADRDRRGRGDRRRHDAGRGDLRAGDQEEPDHLPRGPGLRGQPDPQRRLVGDLARPGGGEPVDPAIDEGVGAAKASPMGPYRSSTCSGWTPCCTSPSTSTRPTATASTCPPRSSASWPRAAWAPRPAGTASTPPTGRQRPRGRRADVAELVERLVLKTFVEAALVLEEGVATHRDIDVGSWPAPGWTPRRGLFPPFMKADMEGLDTSSSASRPPRSSTASASRPRRSCAASSPRAAWAQERAGLLRLPQFDEDPSARSSSSRRAATSASPGWPTAR
jgi:enoyl-CoA hydratase/3-hydroxyacyl-CoA dehydrogenase